VLLIINRLAQAYDIVNTDEIMNWWGGSTRCLRSSYNDVRVGGIWRFTIAGSEGKDYVISGMYREVEPGHRLVYADGMIVLRYRGVTRRHSR